MCCTARTWRTARASTRPSSAPARPPHPLCSSAYPLTADVLPLMPPRSFVRVSITFPTPALPVILNLTAAFLPYASTLTPFLAALPAPFKFVQHSRAHARANAAAMIADADAARLRGNALYARRERRAALDAYDEAVDSLEHVEVLGYGGADARRARPALAVALANRAAAHLLAGPGQDARKALADGSAAVRADPRYVKGCVVSFCAVGMRAG
ncbi:hypothetical protein FA95DRAFT_1566171 [Auriscalpium vulgare]|uniref:Uncharacterized protein n=1 Tax=Auriscalpium vulgare TaxID=40419 RepID=A0ACB8R9N4_9AGAM|nr:hypothetical protein FA95DRAFT_1566171 [Auriscalpium vulgare]